MANVPDSQKASDTFQWWLASDGRTFGPHTEAFIREAFGRSEIAADTMACPVGDNQWRPLTEWPSFSALANPNRNPYASPGMSVVPENSRPAWDPEAPLQVNLICAYCLIARPAIWLLFLLAEFAMPSSIQTQGDFDRAFNLVYQQLLDLLLLGLFIISGLQLKNRRRPALHLVPTALAISILSFAAGIVALLASVAWLLVLPAELETAQQPLSGWDVAGLVLGCFGLLVWLAATCFEAYALVWFYKSKGGLRWEPDPSANRGESP